MLKRRRFSSITTYCLPYSSPFSLPLSSLSFSSQSLFSNPISSHRHSTPFPLPLSSFPLPGPLLLPASCNPLLLSLSLSLPYPFPLNLSSLILFPPTSIPLYLPSSFQHPLHLSSISHLPVLSFLSSLCAFLVSIGRSPRELPPYFSSRPTDRCLMAGTPPFVSARNNRLEAASQPRQMAAAAALPTCRSDQRYNSPSSHRSWSAVD